MTRKLQLWMADRNPAFDKPSLYRRSFEPQPVRPKGWDAVLIGMVSLLLFFIGMGGLLIGLFLLGVIVSVFIG